MARTMPSAVDGKQLGIDPIVAGLQSHLQVMKQIAGQKVLILEDDAQFVEDFNEKFEKVMQTLPEDWDITTNNTLLESWISESSFHDKAYKHGFALPAGTWYVSYRINNDETWADIKSGKLKGFSLAGGFIEKLASEKLQQQTLNAIIDILKQVQ